MRAVSAPTETVNTMLKARMKATSLISFGPVLAGRAKPTAGRHIKRTGWEEVTNMIRMSWPYSGKCFSARKF